MSVCSRCGGVGRYAYDEWHIKPCEVCCKHDKGWWELTEHYQGYVKGSDNRCCTAGCGTMFRDLQDSCQSNNQNLVDIDQELVSKE